MEMAKYSEYVGDQLMSSVMGREKRTGGKKKKRKHTHKSQGAWLINRKINSSSPKPVASFRESVTGDKWFAAPEI